MQSINLRCTEQEPTRTGWPFLSGRTPTFEREFIGRLWRCGVRPQRSFPLPFGCRSTVDPPPHSRPSRVQAVKVTTAHDQRPRRHNIVIGANAHYASMMYLLLYGYIIDVLGFNRGIYYYCNILQNLKKKKTESKP